MKNIKNISYAAVAAFVLTTATSCKRQLEEYNPHNTTAENMYNTPSGLVGLINMSYQDIRNIYGVEDGFFMCESGTDLWYNDAKAGYGNTITQYLALAPDKANVHKNHYFNCYRGINYCNTGITRIDGAGFIDEKEKNQRLGELRFLRAFYYYHIVEQFGGVYLNTKSSLDGVELNPKRSTPEEFYDLMISDLEFAKSNLPVSWPVTEYSRASKKSAAGMLARVLLSRAYYSTGGEAQQWFTKAKDAAIDAINNKGAWGLSLYDNYADIGQSVYGSAAARAANKEAMFVMSYSEANSSFNTNTTGNPGGNRIPKWTLPKYTGRPGLTTAYINAYGIDNEQRLMPTWHMLDLYDETKDARYSANFQELWTANQAFKWTKDNYRNTDKLKYKKDSAYMVSNALEIPLGDTAMFFTKKVWGGARTRRYLEVDRNELYVNPQPGQGAKIVEDTFYTNTCYPAFKKFVNPNRTSTTPTDFGDALIIRLSEMYLIAAEAYVGMGDAASAVPYINVIRDRAGLTGQKAAMLVSAGQVDLNFILDERGREFAGELQRWYDIKRVFHDKNKWAAYLKNYNPDLVSVEPYHWLRPVPALEMTNINNAKEFGQNEGYTQP